MFFIREVRIMGVTLSVIQHGCFNEASEYVIQQIRYLGCRRGYVELLEIFEDDMTKTHFIINRYLYENNRQGRAVDYFEWVNLETATLALDLILENMPVDLIKKCDGFIEYKQIELDKKPWFYKM